MTIATATLSNFRQSPRKMRAVANLVRGKKATDALVMLQFTAKRAASPVATLIASALANAKAKEVATENLVVSTIRVDGGKIMYRRRPAARGSSHPIRKRTCSVFVALGEPTVQTKKGKKAAVQAEAAPVVEKTVKKAAPKKVATKAKKTKE